MEHELIAEWFRFADMDLSTAEYLQGMRPQPLEIICFHCQQSAEKNLKGYLIYNGVTEPPKIHDLIYLNNMCCDFDTHFREIDKACGALNRFSVQPRYPNEIELFESDMLAAIKYAREIQSFQPLAAVRDAVYQSS